MALSRDEIFTKVQGVLVDALGVDEDEVTAKATLREDLGAESIDFLDIVFRLEKAFTTDPGKPFKIPRGELFPEDLDTLRNDPSYVSGGKITPTGMAELRRRMPYADFAEFEKDPSVDKAGQLITVDTIANYIDAKLKAAS
jgi:acyl carrier protein